MNVRILLLYMSIYFFSSIGLRGQEIEIYDDYSDFEHLLTNEDDKIYVINFWATWCAPCVKELPYFEKLNSEYEHNGVEVILASLDFRSQLESRVLPFLKMRRLKSRVVMLADSNANKWIDQVDSTWSGVIPATLIYQNGNRLFLEQEFKSYLDLENLVSEFIKRVNSE